MDKVVTVALAVISLATLTVLLINGNSTIGIIGAGSQGFSNVLGTAMGTGGLGSGYIASGVP